METETQARTPQPKPLVVRRNSVGTGTTSLLMIFTVLCFATLAMLSLSTAVSSKRIQDRGIESSQALAAAKGTAAEAVAALDGELHALRGEYDILPTDENYHTHATSYYRAALDAAVGLGWTWDEETDVLTLIIPVDTHTQLHTTLKIQPHGEPDRYYVAKQVTELADGWNPEDGAGLLLG